MGRQRIVLVWQISLFPITSLGKQGAFSRANRKYGTLSISTPLCLRVRTRDVAKQNERTANMATQMTSDDRKRIEFLAQLGWTTIQIAKDRGRSKSTIIREIANRSIVCDRGYKCSNRISALFDRCPPPKTSAEKELSKSNKGMGFAWLTTTPCALPNQNQDISQIAL